MECPECHQGVIKVLVSMTCSCNHNMLMCDACFKEFNVPCNMPPYDQSALPPELPITASDRMRKAWESAKEDYRKMTDAEDPDDEFADGKTYEDSMRIMLEGMPTVEEFKKQLASQKASEPNAT